jgi:H/ACA ribonucleoprotein complex subunit 3
MREGQHKVFCGRRRPQTLFRLLPDKTLLAQGNQLVVMSGESPVEHLQVDTCEGSPIFDTNDDTYFWLQDGQLMRSGPLGAERIGDILSGQTRFWVGTQLGFGFYRAGDLNVAFVFDPQHRGINDNVRLPLIHGQLVDVTCQLAPDRAWLVWRSKEGAQIVDHAAVILSSGEISATISAQIDAAPWLASASGALAVGPSLLAPTDDGIVRLDVQHGQIVLSKTFPDTEPYVDAASRLLAGPHGVYVIRERTIHLLSINED